MSYSSMRCLHDYRLQTLCLVLAAGILYYQASLAETDTVVTDPQTGLQYYEAGEYEAAVTVLTEAVKQDPENSHYYHTLGKAYGHLAEAASLLKAYKLSVKTRENLERAVEIDNSNVAALRDLKKFYERAPAFLGGGADKAENIQTRLDELARSEPGVISTH